MQNTIDVDTKSTQINIRVTKPLHDSLKSCAAKEVTTTSQLVRKAITFYLRDNGFGSSV
jgi:predicted HicB family RNase H-like nuclease